MPKPQRVISIREACRKAELLAKHGKKHPVGASIMRNNLLDDIALRKAKLYRLEAKSAMQRAEKRAGGNQITATDLARQFSIKIEIARTELTELLAEGCRSKHPAVVKKVNLIKELQGQKRLAKGSSWEEAEKSRLEVKKKKGS